MRGWMRWLRGAAALGCALLLVACGSAPTAAPPAAPSFTATPAREASPAEAHLTPLPTVPLPAPTCTPPTCAPAETLVCPGECADGCGAVCLAATPAPATPTSEVEPEPELEPWQQPFLAVAYIIDGNLWLAIGYNAPRPLTDAGLHAEPLLSPDGQSVLFRRRLPGDAEPERWALWVIDADGANPRRVAAPEDLVEGDTPHPTPRAPYQVAWLSDGRHIAFNTTNPGEYGLVHNDDLWRADVGTGAVERLLPDGEGGTFAVSPDGAHLLVADGDSVALAAADGTGRRELAAFPRVNTRSEYVYVPHPAWLPDGRAGLVAISSPDPLGPEASCKLWRLEVEGEAALVGELPIGCLYHTWEDRLWSPDRQRLAYIDDAEGTLVVAGADGSDAQVYTANASQFIGWAPDSRRFVFRIGEAGYLHLGEMGAPPVLLAEVEEVGDVWDVAWVDEETYVFTAGEFAAPTLWVKAVGEEPRVIDTGVGGFSAMMVR